MEWLAARQPGSPSYLAGLAEADAELGGMLAYADKAGEALPFVTKALALNETLLSGNPGSPILKRAVMNSSLSIARLEADSRDYQSALRRSAEALETAKALSATDAANTMYKRDLWICYFRVAEATAKLGAPAIGLAGFRRSLGYIAELSRADPGDRGHLRGVAVTHMARANLLTQTGKDAAAVTEYRLAIAIGQALELADPRKIETRIDLANMYGNLSEALAHLGQSAPSFAASEKARILFDSAARLDPENAAVSKGRDELRARRFRGSE